MPRTSQSRRRRKSRFTAKTADKHILYQLSVQDVETEAGFLDRTFKSLTGRAPRTLREDFCGTALLCGEWVNRWPERKATGIDIDPKVLAWGREHNIDQLGDAARRVNLLEQDVRATVSAKFDLAVAFNFSYWIFRTRDEMRSYMQGVRRSLAPGGVFFLDAYGGWESQEPMFEERPVRGGFTYVWDQSSFDPITHAVTNFIHFHFQDGTKLQRAFRYDWRFWTLPELTELMNEAGFRDVRVYWDTSDDDRRETYRPRARANNHPGWLAYIVGVK